MILPPLQKLPKNVVDLGKIIVAMVFEKLPNLATYIITIVRTSLRDCHKDLIATF